MFVNLGERSKFIQTLLPDSVKYGQFTVDPGVSNSRTVLYKLYLHNMETSLLGTFIQTLLYHHNNLDTGSLI